jgi:hypothetical protein
VIHIAETFQKLHQQIYQKMIEHYELNGWPSTAPDAFNRAWRDPLWQEVETEIRVRVQISLLLSDKSMLD